MDEPRRTSPAGADSGFPRTGHGDVPNPTPDLPDYTLIRKLAHGGFGEVWLCRSRANIMCAAKLVKLGDVSEIERESIRSYVQNVRNHPHLIDIKHIGETATHFYYIMELADGCSTLPVSGWENYEPRTLASDLNRLGTLSLRDALVMTRQLLDGLAHLHQVGLLHRDIKPSNIVFVDGKLKLADLGLASRQRAEKFLGHSLIFSPPGGVKDKSGDLYCVGRVLFQAVTGASPDKFPEIPPNASESVLEANRLLSSVFDRACAPEAKDRFQDTKEFLLTLRSVEHPHRRVRMVGTIAAATAVIAIGAYAILWSSRNVTEGTRPGSLQLFTEKCPDVDDASPNNLEDASIDSENASGLPLRTGRCLRIQGQFESARYAVIAKIQSTGPPEERVELLFPSDFKRQVATKDVQIFHKSGSEATFELGTPGGPLVLVLLESKRPFSDPEAIVRQLSSLGSPPIVDRDRAVSVTTKGIRYLGATRDTRGFSLKDARPGIVDFFFDRLKKSTGVEFRLAHAIAVMQE